MNKKIKYREATKRDSWFIAECIDLSSDRLASIAWQQEADKIGADSVLTIGSQIYAKSTGDYSYKNSIIAELNEPAGMILSYPITDENYSHNAKPPPYDDIDLYAPYQYLELNNSWYICGVAVAESFRKQGIANELMKLAISKGQQQGYNHVSLIAMYEKQFLIQYYQSLGFQITRQVPIVEHPKVTASGDAVLMVKKI